MKHAPKVKISRKIARLIQQGLEDVPDDSADDDYNPSLTDSSDDENDGCIDNDLSAIEGDDIEYANDDYQPYEDPICANPLGEDVNDVNYIQRVSKNGQVYVIQDGATLN